MGERVLLDADGLTITVPEGTAVDLCLPFENEGDSPCAFTGQLDGPGAAFARLEREQVPLGGYAKGEMVVAYDARSAGTHALRVAVFDGAYLLEPPGWRTVTMVVEGASAIPVAPEPVEPQVAAPEPSVPEAPVAAEVSEPVAAPLKRARPVVKAPEPVLAAPEPIKATVSVEAAPPVPAPAGPEPVPAPSVVSFRREQKPVPGLDPAPTPDPVPETLPVSKARPKVEVKPRTVVEMGEAAIQTPERPAAPAQAPRPYDRARYGTVLANPKTGDVLELAPGGRALVLLEFQNRGTDASTYVLMVKDDLKPAEDFAYARTLVKQVNIRPEGEDELAFELTVPENAAPQTLRLRISHGRADGGRDLEITRLTLKVSPRIAVSLAAAKPKAVVGPLNRTPELALEVVNAGNVDTAYRLTAKRAVDVAADALPGEYPDVESHDGCRFLFDKELEDVRQDGRVPARLRLFRPGIWWLGWWQTARIKAVAVPVTDPRNAGQAGNALDLVGTRWRLLPFPWFVSLPLLLLLFAVFLGGFGVGEVRVANAIRSDEGILFVLQPHDEQYKADPAKPVIPMAARLEWTAPAISWLKVVTHREDAKTVRTALGSATVTQPVKEYKAEDQYRITSFFGLGGKDTARVVYLPLRTTNALGLDFRYGDAKGVKNDLGASESSTEKPPIYTLSLVGAKVPETIGGNKVDTIEFSLTVGPTDRVYITPKNHGSDNAVEVWRLINPKDYEVVSLNKNSVTQVLGNGVGGNTWQILPKPGIKPEGVDHLWFLTTDSVYSVVHVVINRVKEGGQ